MTRSVHPIDSGYKTPGPEGDQTQSQLRVRFRTRDTDFPGEKPELSITFNADLQPQQMINEINRVVNAYWDLRGLITNEWNVPGS